MTGRLTILAVINGNIVETSTSLYFTEDATIGDFDNPFTITVGKPTAIERIMAEGNCKRMQVIDLGGRVFYSGSVAGFDKNSLNEGQYIFEFFTNDGEVICYKQLIRKVTE